MGDEHAEHGRVGGTQSAIFGLVLGIIGLAVSFFSLIICQPLGLVGLLMSLLGLLMSWRSLGDMSTLTTRSDGAMPLISLIVNIVATLVGLLCALYTCCLGGFIAVYMALIAAMIAAGP